MNTMLILLSVWTGTFGISEPVPGAPSPENWTFREELAKPAVYHACEAYRIVDEYGLKGETETVRMDLDRFMLSAGKPATKTVTLRKGAVDGYESYRLDVAANGDVTLTAEDDDGIRRAACYFEDRVSAGDLASVVRKPWLRNRISRCFFGPIKRPPFYRDELMNDIDYYPDEYLNRLAHEGINGLWLTIELRNIVKTSFNERDKDAPRRIAKLRRTVEKCRRYGIRTWIFCIEPRMMDADSPVRKAMPPEALGTAAWGDGKVLCTSHPKAQQYIEEAFEDLFRQVPGLPGFINISHGERATTCLSCISPVTGNPPPCPACAKLEPWQIHWNTASAMVRGMRKAAPNAEYISWFYQPYVEYERAPWVAETARHLPEGVTLIYNFESGAIKNQLGRYRPGGDYWLSYTGPAPAFAQVAEASREANGRIGAKIQVGCSHECATVPFVPVPGLLYRKYRAMREARCTTVMQCWYFGNYPGVMNKAAGELAFSTFDEDEDAFLLKLAKPEWGTSSATVAKLWKDFSDAYAEYPLSNDMQYYGPFHAGACWPLLPDVSMLPLGRTWKPQDPPSGDAIGECLENHTLDEASILADRMRIGSQAKDADGRDVLSTLAKTFADDPDRQRDLGVIRALQLLFAAGSDAFEFYRLREIAVAASRFEHNVPKATAALKGMRARIENERSVTTAMLAIAKDDSRIGFHSEAESHQFHPAKLEWRAKQLQAALARVDEITAVVAKGGAYPLSEHEKSAPSVRVGERTVTKGGLAFEVRYLDNGDFEMRGFVPDASPVDVRTFNVCGTAWSYTITLDSKSWKVPGSNVVTPAAVVRSYETRPKGKGWEFTLVLDARGWGGQTVKRPAWLHVTRGGDIWPEGGHIADGDWRLNIGGQTPAHYARIVE